MDLLAIFGVGTNLMFSLGIIFVIVFTLFYLRQRLSDYDGKLSDMIQVISGMNKEIIYIKSLINQDTQNMINKYSDDTKKVELTTNHCGNIIDDNGSEEQNYYVNLNKENDEDEEDEDEDEEDEEEDEDEDDEDAGDGEDDDDDEGKGADTDIGGEQSSAVAAAGAPVSMTVC